MPVLTNRPSDADSKNDELNPSQQDYDRRFNDIVAAERSGNFSGGNKNGTNSAKDLNYVKDKESRGATGGWSNKTFAKAAKSVSKFRFKKAVPLIGAGGIVGIGGFAMVALTSPSLLIIQMKEVLAEKFNDQLTTLNVRSNKILAKKIGSATTKGLCGTVSLRCRYKTMSKKQLAKLNKAGIATLDSEGKDLAGRGRPASLKVGDKIYDASELTSELKKNPELRSTFNRAYNPRFAAFSDNIASKVNARLKLTKRNILGDATTEKDLTKKLEGAVDGDEAKLSDANIKEGTDEDGNKTYTDEQTGESLSKEEVDAQKNSLSTVDDEVKAKSALKEASGDVAKSTVKGILTVTSMGAGAVDTLCTAYKTVRAVGFASKYVGMLQLVRYAFTFVNTADAIKAGDGTPEQATYVGNILTSVNSEGKSATDSYGYHYAAYNDTAGMPTTDTKDVKSAQIADETLRYVNGQTLSNGAWSTLVSLITHKGATTKVADNTCHFVKSGWGQTVLAGLTLAGAVAAVFTLGLSLDWGTVAQAGASTAFAIAVSILAPKVANILAGTLVDGGENGNEAGNAIVSGMGAYNAQTAQGRGLAVLTKDDAVAYQNLTNETVALYDAADREDKSPFDITDPNTFLGSIALKITPILTKQGSSSILSMINLFPQSIASITANITGTAKAASVDEFSQCNDPDYTDMNLAADPFCNLRYGISESDLNKDPEDVLDYMINNGHIDGETGDAISTDLKDYTKYCVDRTDPIGGYSEDGDEGDLGKGYNCIQGYGDKANEYQMFRLYLVDKSVIDSMEDD